MKTCPRMSVHEEQPKKESEIHTADRIDKNCGEFSPDLIEERIKFNLEPLDAQISTLTQMMNQPTQDNSGRTNPTGGTRVRRFHSESPLTDGPGTSRTLSSTSIGAPTYSSHIHFQQKNFLHASMQHVKVPCLFDHGVDRIFVKTSNFTVYVTQYLSVVVMFRLNIYFSRNFFRAVTSSRIFY